MHLTNGLLGASGEDVANSEFAAMLADLDESDCLLEDNDDE
jgi:hypothetical protein